jgi:membrane-bound lytic murein transglycosylase D
MIRLLTAMMFCLIVSFQACASFDFIKALIPDDPQEKNVLANPVEIADTTLTQVDEDFNTNGTNGETVNYQDTNQVKVNRNELVESNGNGFISTTNRLPELIRDVKIHLTEAIISDVHSDTFEVLYNLDRVFDLLAEADQLGEMTENDQIELERFEQSLIEIYSNRLSTLQASEVPFTAEQLRREVTSVIEPFEIEMGNSKFIVVDDRDGHIPLVRNNKVDQFINFFQTKGRKQFVIWLERKAIYGDLIREILVEQSLPEELIYLAMIESGLNPKAYSRANAVGMWQFVYSTGKLYDLDRNWYVDERRDIIKATYAACSYLSDLIEEFDNWYLALAAYNSGEGRVQRAARFHQTTDFWQLHSLPRETRNYLPYFLAAAIIGQNPAEYGFEDLPDTPIKYDFVELEKSADLSVLARSANISVKILREYNPELRQSATPNNGIYQLKLPAGSGADFEKNFNAIPKDQRFAPQYVRHRVRRGESLWTIAKKYRVSIHDLASVNKIRNRHKIKIGQVLTIPVRGQLASSTSSGGPSGHTKIIYTVRRGDTLGHIAENYNTLARNIRSWNGLKFGAFIHPGQKLVLWVKEG